MAGAARRGEAWRGRARYGSVGHVHTKKEGGNILVYQYKLPGMYPVPAQKAGEELELIYKKHDRISPPIIVDESRPKEAVLHPCFEWDDLKAAEMYRRYQARKIVDCIVTIKETVEKEPVTVRVFHYVSSTYMNIDAILKEQDKMEEMRARAFREMTNFKERFHILSCLSPVFSAIDQVKTQYEKGQQDIIEDNRPSIQ